MPGVRDHGHTSTARFAGTDAEEERRRRRKAARLYGLRNHPPEKDAAAVLRALMRDEAVVPVTPEARTAYVVARWLPGVARRIALVKPPV